MISSSVFIIQYNTSDIKRALDTKIVELSNDGLYDYLPFPTYDMELPASSGPFWLGDSLVIKWDYSEAINDLIPSSSLYLVSSTGEKIIFEDVATVIKNVAWEIPNNLSIRDKYYIKIMTRFDDELIYDTSSTFNLDERYIKVTSNVPKTPIEANTDYNYNLAWNGHGTAQNFKIELISAEYSDKIKFDNKIGRLLLDEALVNNQIISGNQSNIPVDGIEVIKIIEDNYYTNDNKYTWKVLDIPNYVTEGKLRIIDLQNYVVGLSDVFLFDVAKIRFDNYIGRKLIGGASGSTDVIVGVGEGESLLTLFDFIPANFEVEYNHDFKFSYSTTNATVVYLMKESIPSYKETFTKLEGTYTLKDVLEDDVYTVVSSDSMGKLKKATFPVTVKLEGGINETDITKMSPYVLLRHCIMLGEEALLSGDAIIEPGAQIITKIPYYKTEAMQMDDETAASIVNTMLLSVNEDILAVLLTGTMDHPRVLLGQCDLRDRVYAANVHISNMFAIPPVQGVKISGYIKKPAPSNVPIEGVVVHFNNEGGNAITNELGYYEKIVMKYYTGMAVPNHSEYTFNPADRVYTEITSDKPNQNYSALAKIPGGELQISTTSLPPGYINEEYSATLKAINGETPYVWSYSGDALPKGLSLDSQTGVISGTPEERTTKQPTFKVTDRNLNVATKQLSIKILLRP